MLPFPDVPQRQQDYDATDHDTRIVHCLGIEGHRVREHVDDVEDDDVGACDAEDDGTVG